MQKKMFSHFSEGAMKAIDYFCQRVNKSESEVFILMARKSICFIKMLHQSGMLREDFFGKMIVADTSLDFPSDYLKGKKITIVDDIMISGTSIAHMINQLLDMDIQAKNIDVVVLAVNKKYNCMDFSDPETGKIFLDRSKTSIFDDAECITLSNDIAQMIALAGNSFNTDFPEYHRFTISEKEFNNLFEKDLWHIYNVTNIYHKKGNNEVYTFIPKDKALKDIARMIHCDISQFTYFKIRIMAHKTDGGNYSCIIVPLVIIGEVTFENIKNIWKSILTDVNSDIMNEYELNEAALFRLIQFLVPKVMADYFIEQNKLSDNVHFDSSCISLLFGYDMFHSVNDIVEHIGIGQMNSIKEVHSISGEKSSCNGKFNFKKQGTGAFDLNVRLLEPISYWYWQKEIPVREKIIKYVKDNGKINFRADADILEEIDESRRLEYGFSVKTFLDAIFDMKEYYDISAVVSIFLDRAIDMGLIVPTNYILKRGIVCRCFRHGEDFPFGEADQSKLMYFLDELATQLGDEKLGMINFEKMVVLFMQLAKKNKAEPIFSDFESFDNHELLTVKYCIHGAVLVNVKQNIQIDKLHPYVEYNGYCPWLREKLEEMKVVCVQSVQNSKKEEKTGIKINKKAISDNINMSILTDSQQQSISIYAGIIGKWYNLYKEKVNEPWNEQSEDEKLGTRGFKRDITALTSCSSLKSFAGSILAELHYCLLDLNETVYGKLLVGAEEGRQFQLGDDFNLYFGKEMNSVSDERKYKTRAYTAMYNGIAKSDEYLGGGAHSVINRVSALLAESEDTGVLSKMWEKFWYDEDKEKVPLDQELQEWVWECVTYLYIFYISYSELHNLSVEDEDKRIDTQEFRNRYDSRVYKSAQDSRVSQNLIDSVSKLYTEKIYKRQNIQEKQIYICRYLKQLEPQMISVSQNIEMNLAEDSLQYIEKYKSCAIIRCYETDKESVYKDLQQAAGEEYRLIEWEPNKAEGIKQYCLLFRTEKQVDNILESIKNVLQVSQVILFYELPDKLCLKYNVRTNGRDFQKKFQQEIIDCIGTDINTNSNILVTSKPISGEDKKRYCKYFGTSNSCIEENNNIILEQKFFVVRFYVDNFESKEDMSDMISNLQDKENVVNREQKTNNYINIYGNVSDTQFQQGTKDSMQSKRVDTDFDYEAVGKIVEKIMKYDGMLDSEFGKNVNELREKVNEVSSLVQKQKDPSRIRILLGDIKNLAIGVGGGLIASGILNLLEGII